MFIGVFHFRGESFVRRLQFPLLLLLAALAWAQPDDQAASRPSWQAVLAPPDEPGEPLRVSGTVFSEDGKTPVAGATVYVYHTDRHGNYSRDQRNSNQDPRLQGTMSTDSNGRYEYRTIKPGPYPGSRVPAHIHYVVTAPGHQRRVFEIVFAGDPFVTPNIEAQARRPGSIYSLQHLQKDAHNLWTCVQDVTLQKE